MAEQEAPANEQPPAANPAVHVAPSPHLSGGTSTRRMMIDVLIGLAPAMAMAMYVFRWYALNQVVICVAGCMITEAVLNRLRGRKLSIWDGSAIVTGVILAFSLPAVTPEWVTLIAAVTAITLGKFVFGGLGQNIFNPAMVGRAFVMIAFAGFIAAGGYVDANASVEVLTQATPMTHAFKFGHITDANSNSILWRLFLGTTNGSVGETSAIALILGGIYLCIRRAASWELPVGAILSLGIIAGVQNLLNLSEPWTVLHNLFGGAFLLGAFFIITDPVTTPITPRGKLLFGLCYGALVMIIRYLTDYPEGVMFSVLLLNSVTPLINRWTIPKPVGGPVPAAKKN